MFHNDLELEARTGEVQGVRASGFSLESKLLPPLLGVIGRRLEDKDMGDKGEQNRDSWVAFFVAFGKELVSRG